MFIHLINPLNKSDIPILVDIDMICRDTEASTTTQAHEEQLFIP